MYINNSAVAVASHLETGGGLDVLADGEKALLLGAEAAGHGPDGGLARPVPGEPAQVASSPVLM